MNAIHWCLRASIICVTVAGSAAVAHAQEWTRAEWSAQLDLAATSYSGAVESFFLESGTSIGFELRIQHIEESPGAFILKERFIRNVEVTLRDGSDQVVATNAGWKPEGFCPDAPKCVITRTMTLRAPQGAVFFGTLSTGRRPALPEGDYYLSVTLSADAAQRFIATSDGTPWQGLRERPRPIRLVTPRTSQERRLIAYRRASQERLNGNKDRALRLYREILPLRLMTSAP